MSGRFYNIELRQHGDVDLAGDYLDEINDLIAVCVRKCPDGACEGVTTLGGVECFYTCASVGSKVQLTIGPRQFYIRANNGSKVHIVIGPRDAAEEWSPWSRRDA
jgi:hypothetical protein